MHGLTKNLEYPHMEGMEEGAGHSAKHLWDCSLGNKLRLAKSSLSAKMGNCRKARAFNRSEKERRRGERGEGERNIRKSVREG